MKFTANAKTFAVAMAAVQKITERRNNIPILKNSMISASQGRVSLRATDLDMEISLTIEANVEMPGAVTVPAGLLSDVLRKAPDGAEVLFAIDADGNVASVRAGRSNFRLHTLPASDYPELSQGSYSHTIEVTGDMLFEALSKVQFAISTEETRYYLNGVFWNVEADRREGITFVATDGHRLARCYRAVDVAPDFPGIIVPRKTTGEILSLAKAAGDNHLTIDVSEKKIRVTSGETILVSKLIDGSFPEYQRVIPAPSNTVATVKTTALAAAADRVTTISSERGRAVVLSFTTAGLTLSVNNPDQGSAEEEVDVDYGAEDLRIGFNAKYLGDIMSVIGPGDARINLIDPGSPTVIRTDKDMHSEFVLMPMKV